MGLKNHKALKCDMGQENHRTLDWDMARKSHGSELGMRPKNCEALD